MRVFLTLSLILLSFSLANPAQAFDEESIYQCGAPVDNELTSNVIGVCDIYTRQLEYRVKANDLRARIEDRQVAFQTPAKEARERYEESMKKLNEERGIPKEGEKAE